MGLKTKMNKITGLIKAKIFFPAIFNVLSLKARKRQMSILQASCARGALTQYLESLLIAKLRRKFKKQIKINAQMIKENEASLEHGKPKRIWVCWLQGMENAPAIVRICYQSLLDTFGNEYEIKVITEENYENYVQFPDFIIRKYKKGFISRTHFSDLLRLELLIGYGGIWLDSTLFFTGKLPDFMLDSNLFVFQSIWPQLFGRATRTENWFISACQNESMLIFVRNMLYAYWDKFNVLIDYWLAYDMFEFAIEQFPDIWKEVIPVSQCDIHILQDKFLDEFNQDVFDETVNRVHIHKLNWRYNEQELSKPNTYYQYLISHYKQFSIGSEENERFD